LRESKEYIHERYLKAREIVAMNRQFIDALVSALLKKKVLLVSEIDEIQKRYPIVKPNKPLQ
jgi:ATP-dependent Zn protease